MWAQVTMAVIGVWLMAAPDALGYGGAARLSDRVAGPVAATFAIIAISEVVRPVRRVNLLVGLWLVISPWLLGSYPAVAIVNSTCAGGLLELLSLVRTRVRGRYGGGWIALVNGFAEAAN
jgi:hypothetical protein